jgi:hypothetical protein
MNITINYLAVLGATVASMVVGFLWYGPLFGKQWMKLMGFTKEHMDTVKAKGMSKMYVLTLIGSFVMAFVLAHFAKVWSATGVSGAWELAFWSWLGFIAPVMLGQVLWEGKSWKLYCLNVVYQLVNVFVIALVLVYWM